MKVYGARDGIAKAFNGRLGSGWDLGWVQGGQRDNCQAIWDRNMLGRVQAAVGALAEPLRAWALWCYTDCQGKEDMVCWEQAILVEVIRRYDERPAIEFPKLGSMLSATGLLYAAMQDVRHRERCGVEKYSLAEMARKVGLNPSDLYPGRRWRVFLDAVLRLLDDVVAETLGPVAAVVDEINERRKAA